MPRYLDIHRDLTRVPIPQRNELLGRRDRGEEDEHGVLPLNILFGVERGVYCLNPRPTRVPSTARTPGSAYPRRTRWSR